VTLGGTMYGVKEKTISHLFQLLGKNQVNNLYNLSIRIFNVQHI